MDIQNVLQDLMENSYDSDEKVKIPKGKFEAMKGMLAKQNQFIEHVENQIHEEVATIIKPGKAGEIQAIGETGRRLKLDFMPEGITFDEDDFEVGDSVITVMGKFIKSKFHDEFTIGSIYTITKQAEYGYCQISENGDDKSILVPETIDADEVTVGARVLLNQSKTVIKHVFSSKEDQQHVVDSTGVTWDDIGGNAEAKSELKQAIELPILKKDVFEFYGKDLPRGFMLYGPPGCGKTMFGKAIVSALNDLHDTDTTKFMYVKATELLNEYVGTSEARIRKVFNDARRHENETGAPAVIFFDEVDAILGQRGGRHSFMEKTIVPTFLTEMDGMGDSKSIVIMATNRSDTLDSAIVRDGRIDRKIKIDRPDKEACRSIFNIHMNGVPLSHMSGTPLSGKKKVNTIINQAVNHLFDDQFKYHNSNIYLRNLVSGAMIAGIVQKAVGFAIERDISSDDNPKGVTVADILKAVETKFDENADTIHNEAQSELI